MTGARSISPVNEFLLSPFGKILLARSTWVKEEETKKPLPAEHELHGAGTVLRLYTDRHHSPLAWMLEKEKAAESRSGGRPW